MVSRAEAGADEVILVTVRDRLLTDMESQNELRSATLRLLNNTTARRETTDWFTVERIVSPGLVGAALQPSEREFYRAYTEAFGENCHVAGAMTEIGSCVLVARSEHQDDHSKP